MQFVTENSLKALLESAKTNKKLASSVQSVQLVNHYELANLIATSSSTTDHLRELFVQHLKSKEIKAKNTSSFTIISTNNATYTIVVKQKHITLTEIDLLHNVFPKLKSFSLYMFNLRYPEAEDFKPSKAANSVSTVDMTFNTSPEDLSKLILYIFDTFDKKLTTLKIRRGGNILNKDKKWSVPSDVIVTDGKNLLKQKHNLSKLETVEISHFYQQFPMVEFIKSLSESNCALKHASLIGVADSEPILLLLKKFVQKSLNSLALDTNKFPNLQTLEGFSLKSLTLRWADEAVIDIVSVLQSFPTLTNLDLGYDVDYVRLDENKAKSNQKFSLKSLTLHRAILDEHILDNFAKNLPALANLKLSECKFGSSRASVQETLLLEKYRLEQVVLENCSLYSGKKDSIDKRMINKLNIIIDSSKEYSAEIASKIPAVMAKHEHISNIGNEFSYYNETESRPTNTLKLLLKTIKSIKFDTMGLKAVDFVSNGDESDLVIEDIAIEEEITNDVSETEEKASDDDQEPAEEPENSDADKTDNDEEQVEEPEQKPHKLNESDQDFESPEEDSDSDSESSSSESESAAPTRRSKRTEVLQAEKRVSSARGKPRKRTRYNSHISNAELSENSSEESSDEFSSNDDGSQSDSDESEHKVMDQEAKKRMAAFTKNIRLLKPVLKVYPSSSMKGYYN